MASPFRSRVNYGLLGFLMLVMGCKQFLDHHHLVRNSISESTGMEPSLVRLRNTPMKIDVDALLKKHIPSRTKEEGNVRSSEFHLDTLATDCLSNLSPVPVILLTLGRSGSHSTWQLLGNLTGLETLAHEYTGTSAKAAEFFFARLDDSSTSEVVQQNWVIQHMCKKQGDNQEESSSNIVGFKWKPFWPTFKAYPEPLMGLQSLAQLARITGGKPLIRVVRSRRNLLDVHLSRVKHQQFESLHDGKRLPPHCHVGSKQCVKLHAQILKNKLQVPNVDKLYKALAKMDAQENALDSFLRTLGVPTVFVSYETLYYPPTPAKGAIEWNRILDSLHPTQPNHSYTYKEIMTRRDHIPGISSTSHQETIGNYEEVAAALNGTPMEGLLH